jgi:hypothetical protein
MEYSTMDKVTVIDEARANSMLVPSHYNPVKLELIKRRN